MKIVFELDTEDLVNGGREKKLSELKEIEKIVFEEIRKVDENSNRTTRYKLDDWLRSIPDRPF